MASTACLMPNSGLARHYTFAKVLGDLIYLGTAGGEICIFNIDGKVYKATMPVASNGLPSFEMHDNLLFVGSGDGKVKRLMIGEDGRWNLTHEAQLDSKIQSLYLNHDNSELIVGTLEGKIYRVRTEDLSFLLHTDTQIGGITDISFASNPKEFLSIDSRGVLKLFDLTTFRPVVSFSADR